MLQCSNTEDVIMPKEVKTGHVKTHVPESTFVSLLSGWVQQGIENFLATQRILVDLAMRQNTGVVNFVRERVGDSEYCPMATVGEVLGEGVSNFVEGQKLLLNLARQECEIVVHGVKERVGDFTPAVAVTDLVQRSLDTFVEMHQDFLKNASKQTHAWLAAVKARKTYDPEGLVEMARDSFDNFVRTQKKFLNVVTEETAKVTSGNGAAKKVKKTELTELAQQATDSFIEAQKKLMDLAAKQVNVNLKAAGRTLDMVAPFSVNPLPEITRAGVKTFVDTEKALIDTVTKHRAETKAGKVEGHRRRHARPIKVAVTHHATA
jgi:hypothetical protein